MHQLVILCKRIVLPKMGNVLAYYVIVLKASDQKKLTVYRSFTKYLGRFVLVLGSLIIFSLSMYRELTSNMY